MSAKMYVELDPLVEFLEHQYPRHPVLLDYVRRRAVMPPPDPPDPPDHGPHLGATELVRMLERRIRRWVAAEQLNAEDNERDGVLCSAARRREAEAILAEVRAAIDAQKEQSR